MASSIKKGTLTNRQSRRLRAQFSHIYDHNAFFRDLYQRAGFSPENFDESAFFDIPFTTKDDFRANYPTGHLCCPSDAVVRAHMSSGSTGAPVTMLYTEKDLEMWTRIMRHCFLVAGVGPRDIVQNMNSLGLFTGGFGYEMGLESVGAMVIPSAAGNTERQIRLMREWDTTVLAGTPSYVGYVAEILKEKGINIQNELKLRLALVGGEYCSDHLKSRIEDSLALRFHGGGLRRCYGLTELGGPLAMECPASNGIHIWSRWYYAEAIDTENLRSLSAGGRGELVLSNLAFEATPVLRFRTGDIVTLDLSRCACGRSDPRITAFHGRTDDMMVVGGVNVLPASIEDVLLGNSELGEAWRLFIDEEKGLPRLTVQVEVRRRFHLDAPGLKSKVETQLKQATGVTIKVVLASLGSLPRSEGKSTRVIDRRTDRMRAGKEL